MDTKTEDHLLQLTKDVSVAAEQNDRATLERLLDDGFMMVLQDGRSFSKAEMIEMWTGAAPDITEQGHAIDDARVHVFGTTAIVVAIVTDKWKDKGEPRVYTERFFDVWQRDDTGWRWVASKPTRVVSE